MDRTFACPECRNELQLKGLTAGRQVRCSWCNTVVEVPFLPRAAGQSKYRGGRKRRPAWVVWAWSALAVAGMLIVALGARHSIRAKERQRVDQNLTEHTRAAENDEKAGRLDQAVSGYDEAIRVAGQADGPKSIRLDDLRQRRDKVARQSVQKRLAAVSALAATNPREAVVEGQALLSYIRRDRGVKDMEGEIQDAIVRMRTKQAESDMAIAHRALDSGRYLEAISLCEQTAVTVGYLDSSAGVPLAKDAEAVMTRIVEHRGIVLEPTTGEFTLGSIHAADQLLHPILADSLRKHGYVPQPSSSHWLSLWESQAPYRLNLTLKEAWGTGYMHSKNRTSVFQARVSLNQNGTTIWSEGPITARTSPQLPNLPVYQGRRLSLDGIRHPEFERILYDEAHAKLVESLTGKLQNLPDLSPTTPGT